MVTSSGISIPKSLAYAIWLSVAFGRGKFIILRGAIKLYSLNAILMASCPSRAFIVRVLVRCVSASVPFFNFIKCINHESFIDYIIFDNALNISASYSISCSWQLIPM